jgi:hypothetical protein
MTTKPYAFTDQEYEDALDAVLDKLNANDVIGHVLTYADDEESNTFLAILHKCYYAETIAYIDDYAAMQEQP